MECAHQSLNGTCVASCSSLLFSGPCPYTPIWRCQFFYTVDSVSFFIWHFISSFQNSIQFCFFISFQFSVFQEREEEVTDIARHVEIKCFLQHFEIAGQQRKDSISRDRDTQAMTRNVTMRMTREPAASTKWAAALVRMEEATPGATGNMETRMCREQATRRNKQGLAGKRARLL